LGKLLVARKSLGQKAKVVKEEQKKLMSGVQVLINLRIAGDEHFWG
jgi:hypothetical protein